MSEYKGVKFTDADVVDVDDWIPEGEYNPHRVRPWLLVDHGFVVCVVFADCEQNALDAAVDADKMERYLLNDEDRINYDSEDDERISYLGNAGEPHDIDGLEYLELPNPSRPSFCEAFDKLNGSN